MKKILSVSLLVAMLVVAFAPVVSAATTASTLAADLLAIGAKYGMTAEDKLQIERYLSSNEITDEQAQTVMDNAQYVVEIMEYCEVTNYNELPEGAKEAVKQSAIAACDAVDLTISFQGGKAIVKDSNNKTVIELSNNDGKIKYSGKAVSAYVIVPVVAMLALAIAVVAKKRLADAE